ncbi:MAG TPA: hypothetical protein VGO86_04635 [Candidatus Dormibacteraeota bacterium]
MAALLALTAVAYVLAAWTVAPGFYDGIAPPAPYRWVSPPPQFRGTNQPPESGRTTFRVGGGGAVDAGTAYTRDNQASIAFAQGALATPADRAPVTVDIVPQTTFPPGGDVHLATNVYCITSSSPLAPGQTVVVSLQYSDQLPAPSDVYVSDGAGPWRKIGSTGSAPPYFIAARSSTLGCFAGGYPANARQTAPGLRLGGSALPDIVALAILVVVLAGIPLALLRRRGEGEESDEHDE